MAIKHIEIQHNGNVSQSDLDEIYIAMDNLDNESKVEGEVTIGNYTPMVVNKLESNFSGLHIIPTGKKYIEINPKDRAIQKEFAKYSDDGSGHVTEESAAKVTSISINTAAAEVWDFDGGTTESWFESFSNVKSMPMFRDNSTVKRIKYTGQPKQLSDYWCSTATELFEVVINGIIAGQQLFVNCKKLTKVKFNNAQFISSGWAIFLNCSKLYKVSLEAFPYYEYAKTIFSGCSAMKYAYLLKCSLQTLKKIKDGGVSCRIIIGYLGTDKVGEDGTNWTYNSYDDESPDESLMACYDQNLYDYMVGKYGETEALARIPSKEDYLNSRG